MLSQNLKKLNELVIKGKDRNIKELLETELTDNKIILNTKYYEGITLLCQAVRNDRFTICKLLLEKGANPNGITPEGNTDTIPLAYILESKNIFENRILEYIKLFLQFGLDINYYGNDLKTLLDHLINFAIKRAVQLKILNVFLIKYILQKGANPNIKISQALFSTVKYMNIYSYSNISILHLFNLLIYYNANPYLVNIEGYTFSKYIELSQKIIPDIKKKISENVFVNLNDILKKCENPLQIKKLANAFKIPYKEADFKNKSKLQEICQCITLIKENFQVLTDEDFQDFIEKRSNLNNLQCENISTINMVDLNEFFVDNLYTVKIGKNQQHCFTKNELAYLLKDKKNPWNGQELKEDEIKDIIKNLQVEPYTDTALEDAIEIFKKQSIIDFTLQDLLEVVSQICNPVNSYPAYQDLIKINNETLFILASDVISANLVNRLNFNITKGIKLDSGEYTKLKLFNFLSETIKYLTYYGPDPENLDAYKFSFFIEKALLLNELKDKVMNLLVEKYNVDLINSQNFRTLRKTPLTLLPTKTLIDMDGYEIPVYGQLVEDIIEIIMDSGENLYKLNVYNREDAIELWNNQLGYTISFY